ncbi:glycine betaine/proline transport system ATP-binding protein [Salinihabitans flavidus]|uniref:Quaternary amine transport ATP-binding protein n=1 Tax=Salinihabitans flavidus TaxID=569882 RepID=A0A1H8MRY0_9RHOB|nr:betaine/proline/choline family ABC transporter ATP-binding protein [Salinihabitans flavidus]SEO20182.1 glycine betaine/proline transport system ATP-binding protein [Salinihabitans flavidus]
MPDDDTPRSNTPEPKLVCRNLWKVFGTKPETWFKDQDALRDPASLAERMRDDGLIPAAVDVNFEVAQGEIFVIMGLSGSGKSTVLRCLSRLVEPTYGEVLLDGEDLLRKSARELIEIRRHKMGMVFQNFGLMPHLNVIENVTFPLALQGMPEKERRKRVENVISLVGLEGREDSYPHQLSGGQQQRVGIARSLAVEPDLWLLDEPFSALDPMIRRQMQDEFLHIQSTLKKSIIFITHDFLEALRIADRIMLMRDGMVVQIGSPVDLITDPADSYVAEFTRDVPLVRVMTAADALAPGGAQETPEGLPEVDSTATLEDLLPQMAGRHDSVIVRKGDRVIGQVTPESLIDALAKRTKAHDAAMDEDGSEIAKETA